MTIPTMPVELTEKQLGLLKACTSAQKQLLRDEALDPSPTVREACHNQMRECTELHDILTAAQFAFMKVRREAGITDY